jgi:hypothetical protein
MLRKAKTQDVKSIHEILTHYAECRSNESSIPKFGIPQFCFASLRGLFDVKMIVNTKKIILRSYKKIPIVS